MMLLVLLILFTLRTTGLELLKTQVPFQCNYPCAKEMTSSAFTCSYLLRLGGQRICTIGIRFSLLALSKFLTFVWKYHFTIAVHSCPIIFPSLPRKWEVFWDPEAANLSCVRNTKCLYLLLLAASSFSVTKGEAMVCKVFTSFCFLCDGFTNVFTTVYYTYFISIKCF